MKKADLNINSGKNIKVIPVIMAGGAGTRLWPLSREEKPKQFHNLSGEGTLLEETIKRLIPLKPDLCLVITALKYEKDSLSELGKTLVKGGILAEPYPRNTAAAVLYAATYLSKMFDDSLMIVLPADHYIKKKGDFLLVLEKALEQARENRLVTIGLKPTYPETGYGYIKVYEDDDAVHQVDMFIEKPNLETAKRYIMDGHYYWNSGIFAWRTSVIMEYFKKLMPRHFDAFAPLRELSAKDLASNRQEVWAVKEKVFGVLESISIDYGIMEKADNRVMIPGSFGWGDLGSWNSIDDILVADADMNRSPEREKVLFVNSKNCSVFAEKKRVVLLGTANLVVVESGDDILIMDKNSAQDVRKVVEVIKEKKSAP